MPSDVLHVDFGVGSQTRWFMQRVLQSSWAPSSLKIALILHSLPPKGLEECRQLLSIGNWMSKIGGTPHHSSHESLNEQFFYEIFSNIFLVLEWMKLLIAIKIWDVVTDWWMNVHISRWINIFIHFANFIHEYGYCCNIRTILS